MPSWQILTRPLNRRMMLNGRTNGPISPITRARSAGRSGKKGKRSIKLYVPCVISARPTGKEPHVKWGCPLTFSTEKKDAPIDRLVLIALFDYSWWILGSLIGGLLGAAATIELAGFDFVLTSLFAMLLCEQWRGRVNSKPLWVALIGYAVARFISADNALAIAIAICALGAILFAFQKKPLPKVARSAGGSSHE